MELVGVTYHNFDYRIMVAAEKGYPIYICSRETLPADGYLSINVVGTLDDLIDRIDVMVDCSPKGLGAITNRAYEKAAIKAIFQGGEKHELTGVSFTAQVNYDEALNKQFVRVVSCNTTGLYRVMNALNKRNWVKKARVVLMRRVTDP